MFVCVEQMDHPSDKWPYVKITCTSIFFSCFEVDAYLAPITKIGMLFFVSFCITKSHKKIITDLANGKIESERSWITFWKHARSDLCLCPDLDCRTYHPLGGSTTLVRALQSSAVTAQWPNGSLVMCMLCLGHFHMLLRKSKQTSQV